jgi:hypothetical protein
MAKKAIEAENEATTNPIVEEKRKIVKKEFSLSDFKKDNKLDKKGRNKPERWLQVSKAFQKVTGLPGGICLSNSHLAYGYENTGKSTLMLELAISAQKEGILPVFLITEQKHRWNHAIQMGMDITENVDEDGVVSYEGFFLHYDRNDFNTVEEMAKIIHGLIDQQEKGKLPHDLLFLVDSFGKLNCDKGIKNGQQFNPQWVATAVAHEFGASVIPRINMSISENFKYTNTLFSIVQPWTELPETYGQLPRLTPKSGKSLPQDSALCYKFGGNTNSNTRKMKIKKKGKEVVWATLSRIEVEKNHLTNVSTRGKIISTKDGFITEDEAKEYFEKNAEYFLKLLDTDDLDGVEFEEEEDKDE